MRQTLSRSQEGVRTDFRLVRDLTSERGAAGDIWVQVLPLRERMGVLDEGCLGRPREIS